MQIVVIDCRRAFEYAGGFRGFPRRCVGIFSTAKLDIFVIVNVVCIFVITFVTTGLANAGTTALCKCQFVLNIVCLYSYK